MHPLKNKKQTYQKKEKKHMSNKELNTHTKKFKALEKKINLLLIVEVINGNPNGNPDANNMPRTEPESGLGYYTDVCTKRKIRDTTEIMHPNQKGMSIFIHRGAVLDGAQKEAMNNVPRPEVAKGENSSEVLAKYARDLKKWMCDNFFDVRAFGAVCQHLTKKTSEGGAGIDGAITGPVQFNFGESVDPVNIERVAITRCALANEKEKEKDKNNTMGVKYVVPYGLYVQHCSISPHLAKQTGFSEDDLDKLIEAITKMYELDKAAGRGEVRLRKLIMFEHNSKWGSAPENKCYESVEIKKKENVDTPNSFEDYEITYKNVPENVTRTVIYDN